MLQWFFNKYKLAMLISVIMVTHESVNRFEESIISEMVSTPDDQEQYESTVKICPPRITDPTYTYVSDSTPYVRTKQDALLYWTTNEYDAVLRINSFSPIFSMIYAGIYSDKYGGKNTVLVGLVLSGTVLSVSYFVMFQNNLVFLAMVLLRWMGSWMVLAGALSLIGKMAMPDERTMFISILLIGQSLGGFLGGLVASKITHWRTLCYACGLLSFTTALWWWAIFQFQYVPKTPTFIHIPWKDMLTAVSFYTSILLILSNLILWFLTTGGISWYFFYVLHFNMENEWIMVFLLFLTNIFGHVFCGAVSDYIISNQLLSVSCLRRIISSIVLILIFCTFLFLNTATCHIEFAIARFMFLNYIFAILQSTFFAATLDVTSAFSGILISVALTVSYPLRDKVIWFYIYIAGPVVTFEEYYQFFLWLTAFSAVLALPLILYGLKKTSWGDGVSQVSNRITEMKSRTPRAEDVALERNPGPSKLPNY